MIDEESGLVTGIIDLEGATSAPLWECAIIPRCYRIPTILRDRMKVAHQKLGKRYVQSFWSR